MFMEIIKKILSLFTKRRGLTKERITSDIPKPLPTSPEACKMIVGGMRKHEPWKTAYHDADIAFGYFKIHGLDLTCGIKLKDGRLILPLYDVNLKIKCDVAISEEGKPAGIKLQIGDHFLIGDEEPIFVVPDIISACIMHQELGVSSAIYLGKQNIPAMTKLFPNAKFIVGGEAVKLAEANGVHVIDLTEDDHIATIPDRFNSGDDLAGFLGLDSSIIFRPLWAALRAFRATEWILKEYIAAGPSLSLIFAPSGVGKTFIVLDLFLTLSVGMHDWHGIECRKARSLYMCAEGYAAVIPRVQCWLEQHHIDDVHGIDFWVENGSVCLDDPSSVELLQDCLERRFRDNRPDIIAVDTMNLFMKGDENSTQCATAFVQSIKALAAENNCTILLVHHTGIADEKRSRGSSVFKGSLDTELRLSKGENPEILFFNQTKNRLGRLMEEEIAFRLEEHETSFEYDSGEKVTSCILQRIDDVTAAKKPTQESLDVGLMAEAFRSVYKECPDSLKITKEQLKSFASGRWKDKGAAEISRQINPKQETRWIGRLVKSGVMEVDDSGTTFKIVKDSAVDAIHKAFTKEEAPN